MSFLETPVIYAGSTSPFWMAHRGFNTVVIIRRVAALFTASLAGIVRAMSAITSEQTLGCVRIGVHDDKVEGRALMRLLPRYLSMPSIPPPRWHRTPVVMLCLRPA